MPVVSCPFVLGWHIQWQNTNGWDAETIKDLYKRVQTS